MTNHTADASLNKIAGIAGLAFLVVIVLFELTIGFWLLFKGVNVQQGDKWFDPTK